MSLDGPAWPARPATINTRRFQVRQLISALVRRGHDISEFEALRDLVDPTVAKEALRFFHERNGKTTSSQIAGLVAVVFIIAKYWCKLDGEPLEQLALLKRKLAYRVKGMTSKNRDRLRQFTDRRNIEALIHFPQTVYDAVSGRNGISIANCLDMQVAVAVEMLLMMPVRRANLVRLRFGPEGHIRPRQDRKGTTHIVINGREVKSRGPRIPSSARELRPARNLYQAVSTHPRQVALLLGISGRGSVGPQGPRSVFAAV